MYNLRNGKLAESVYKFQFLPRSELKLKPGKFIESEVLRVEFNVLHFAASEIKLKNIRSEKSNPEPEETPKSRAIAIMLCKQLIENTETKKNIMKRK